LFIIDFNIYQCALVRPTEFVNRKKNKGIGGMQIEKIGACLDEGTNVALHPVEKEAVVSQRNRHRAVEKDCVGRTTKPTRRNGGTDEIITEIHVTRSPRE